MQIEVWTLPDCSRCSKVKAGLTSAGLAFEERSIADLQSGKVKDVDALAALAMNDYQAPLVRMDGRFMERHELVTLTAGCGDACSVGTG